MKELRSFYSDLYVKKVILNLVNYRSTSAPLAGNFVSYFTKYGGSWVQIPSGARIFSEFSKHLIYHVFVVSSLIYFTKLNENNDDDGDILAIRV